MQSYPLGMLARAIAVLAVCLLVVPAAGAAKGRLLVDPQRPFVGKRAVIEVQARLASPAFVQLVSPTGVHMKLRLTRDGAGLWRAAFHFTDDGEWLVRVPRARAAAKVLVFQPGGALPPFKPNAGAKPNALGSLAAGGVVIG